MIGHCGQWGPASPGHCCIIGDGVVITAPHSLPQCNCGSRIKWFTLLENLFYSISSVQFKPLQQYLGTVWVHWAQHRGLSQLLISTQSSLSLVIRCQTVQIEPQTQIFHSPQFAHHMNSLFGHIWSKYDSGHHPMLRKGVASPCAKILFSLKVCIWTAYNNFLSWRARACCVMI